MTLRIGPCTPEELEKLLSQQLEPNTARHHRERFALQEDGAAVYLLAWRDDQNVGRATLYLQSKYDEVRRTDPDATEINALEAIPQGQGTGTALIRAAEAEAARLDRGCIGLGVEVTNPAARRLYERLGYSLWGGGQVIDEWTEHRGDGTEVPHADPCDYLIKTLAHVTT